MKPSPTQLAALVAPIEPELEAMRTTIVEQLSDGSGAVSDMTGHVARFRGKQLRGSLVLLVARALGRSHEELPAVAAVVEMIHLATLVHDDILDGAKVRRRVASVNQRWDNQIAVLLGDFLYARAFALSTQLSDRMCSSLLAETTRKLCVGEIEQSTRRYDFEQAPENIERIAAAKTASLYAAAAELGARYPDGTPEQAREMARFGHELGLAFQLVDDCLDLVGTEETVGKSMGTDVADGKVTLPVLTVYREATPEVRAAIRDAYTRPDLEDRVAHLSAACDLQPGIDATLARAGDLADSARARLNSLPESAARQALDDLCGFVLARSF